LPGMQSLDYKRLMDICELGRMIYTFFPQFRASVTYRRH